MENEETKEEKAMKNRRWLGIVIGAVAIVGVSVAVIAQKQGTPAPAPGQAQGAADGKDLLEFVPEVVATYKGGEITGSDVKEILQSRVQMMARMGRTPEKEQLKEMVEQAATQLIDMALLQEEARSAGVKVTKDDVDEQIDEIKGQLGEDRFRQAMEMQGFTMDELRTQLKDQLLIQKWVDEKVKPQIDIAEKQLKSYYEENTEEFETPEKRELSHILFKADQEATEEEQQEARERASEIRETLEEKDVEFSEVAKEHSEGPSSSQGGSLGFVAKGQMVPAFEEAAFKLEEGEVSDLVKTRFGYHIIKAGKTRPAATESFDEAKDTVKEQIQQERISNKIQKLLDEKREQADVSIKL